MQTMRLCVLGALLLVAAVSAVSVPDGPPGKLDPIPVSWNSRVQHPAAPTCLHLGVGGYVNAQLGHSDAAADHGYHVAADAPFTVEAWIKPSHGGVAILEKHHPDAVHDGDTATNYLFFLGLTGDDTRIGMLNTMMTEGMDVEMIPMGKTHLCVDRWHHVAAAFDGHHIRFYVDGQLDGVNTFYVGQQTDGSLFLGRDSSGRWLDGGLREVRVWNVSRSQDEIIQWMRCELNDAQEGLVGYFKLSEGRGNEVIDTAAGAAEHEALAYSPSWRKSANAGDDHVCPPLKADLCLDGKCRCPLDVRAWAPNCPEEVDASCPHECNAHGVCQRGGVCLCDEGWHGDGCQFGVCPGNCTSPAHGSCITRHHTAVCLCNAGYWGEDCGGKACPGKDVFCSAHGECTRNGTCVCEAGWGEADCSVETCERDCTGHGTCKGGVCDCFPGWAGSACEHEQCPRNCSRNGVCELTGCHCHEGWGDVDCNTPVCLKNCSQHGTCKEGGLCACFGGWTGKTCELAEDYCPQDCAGHGACEDVSVHKDGTAKRCNCDKGWAGHACTQRDLDCPANCTNADNGACDRSTGVCKCTPQWTGPSCAIAVCPADCSEHGSCVQGRCVCDPGWAGDDCSRGAGCRDDCNAHGECVDERCVCSGGWTGLYCEEVDTSSGADEPAPLTRKDTAVPVSEWATGYTSYTPIGGGDSQSKAEFVGGGGFLPMSFQFRDVVTSDYDDFSTFKFKRSFFHNKPEPHFGSKASGWSWSGAYWGDSFTDGYSDTLSYFFWPVAPLPVLQVNATFDMGPCDRPADELSTIHFKFVFTPNGKEWSVLAQNRFVVQCESGRAVQKGGVNYFPDVELDAGNRGFYAILLNRAVEHETSEPGRRLEIADRVVFKFKKEAPPKLVTRADAWLRAQMQPNDEKQFSVTNGLPLEFRYACIVAPNWQQPSKFFITDAKFEAEPYEHFGSRAAGMSGKVFFWRDTTDSRYSETQAWFLQPVEGYPNVELYGNIKAPAEWNTRANTEVNMFDWQMVYSPDGTATEVLASGSFKLSRRASGEAALSGDTRIPKLSVQNFAMNSGGSLALFMRNTRQNDANNGGIIGVMDDVRFTFSK